MAASPACARRSLHQRGLSQLIWACLPSATHGSHVMSLASGGRRPANLSARLACYSFARAQTAAPDG
eukprot:1530013-Alexandrium_andersonii.AAC.1